eukprot:29124-Chlamydomonas_euryale.AAC.1
MWRRRRVWMRGAQSPLLWAVTRRLPRSPHTRRRPDCVNHVHAPDSVDLAVDCVNHMHAPDSVDLAVDCVRPHHAQPAAERSTTSPHLGAPTPHSPHTLAAE